MTLLTDAKVNSQAFIDKGEARTGKLPIRHTRPIKLPKH